MTENLADPLKLEPIGVSSDGRRHYYDAQAKQKVVEACLQPGVSLAGVALRAGVNANLLRRWVKLHQQQHNGAAATQVVVESAAPAFVPVVEISRADTQPEQPRLLPAGHEPGRTLPRPSAPSRLTVEMPNGVMLRLECSGQDAALVSAMIETLGRCHVPPGR
jgi:transposase